MNQELEKEVCKRLGIPIGCRFEVKHCWHENQNRYVDRVFEYTKNGLSGCKNDSEKIKLLIGICVGRYEIRYLGRIIDTDKCDILRL